MPAAVRNVGAAVIVTTFYAVSYIANSGGVETFYVFARDAYQAVVLTVPHAGGWSVKPSVVPLRVCCDEPEWVVDDPWPWMRAWPAGLNLSLIPTEETRLGYGSRILRDPSDPLPDAVVRALAPYEDTAKSLGEGMVLYRLPEHVVVEITLLLMARRPTVMPLPPFLENR